MPTVPMGWPLLGDDEGDKEEHRHGDEQAVPGRTASTDALLQFGDEGVVVI